MSNTLMNPVTPTISDLAQILFSSELQASEHPSPEEIRTAIVDRLCACGGDHAACTAVVAQEAGDHPEIYTARMRWALRAVSEAYTTAA